MLRRCQLKLIPNFHIRKLLFPAHRAKIVYHLFILQFFRRYFNTRVIRKATDSGAGRARTDDDGIMSSGL
jgi:hypothetical protein